MTTRPKIFPSVEGSVRNDIYHNTAVLGTDARVSYLAIGCPEFN